MPDEQLWAEKYSGTMDDFFDVQERVSRAIVSALRVTLSASEDTRLAERPIKNARAFELYLKAQVLVRPTRLHVDHAVARRDEHGRGAPRARRGRGTRVDGSRAECGLRIFAARLHQL